MNKITLLTLIILILSMFVGAEELTKDQMQQISERKAPRPRIIKPIKTGDPMNALVSAVLLPGGGAFYNDNDSDGQLHMLLQLGVPIFFGVIANKIEDQDARKSWITAAWLIPSIDKLFDMYKGFFDTRKRIAVRDN